MIWLGIGLILLGVLFRTLLFSLIGLLLILAGLLLAAVLAAIRAH